MSTHASSSAAKAALLKSAGRGLLDEEVMETVIQDMELVGGGMTKLAGGVTEVAQRMDRAEAAMQRMTQDMTDMAGNWR